LVKGIKARVENRSLMNLLCHRVDDFLIQMNAVISQHNTLFTNNKTSGLGENDGSSSGLITKIQNEAVVIY